jgi:signal transduction histidine kinase
MDKDPGEALERFVAEEVREAVEAGKTVKVLRPGGRVRAFAGFLAFFLGVTLTLSSLGTAANRVTWERDPVPRFAEDWQETERFRSEVSSYLRDFLTIGAGGRPDFYSYDYWDYWLEAEEGGELGCVLQEATIHAVEEQADRWLNIAGIVDKGSSETFYVTGPEVRVGQGSASSDSVPSSDSASVVPAPEKERDPDEAFQNDKNVLYFIETAEKKTYSNAEGSLSFFQEAERLRGAGTVDFSTVDQGQRDYNFFLTFQNGRVSIIKDGVSLDVYGNGFYDRDSLWFVPGYDNFPVSDDLEGVTVHMAVRQNPIRYYGVDYRTGSSYSGGSMYNIAQQVEETRSFYRTQAALFAAGLACLFVWFCLRKNRLTADRKIAAWTCRVWTEARFLLVLACLWWAFLPGIANLDFVYELLYGYGYGWDGGYSFASWGMAVLRLVLSNIPGLLALYWLVWLIRNDHRHNPREVRRSLLRPFFRALRARDLKRPIEKRLSRRAALFALIALLLGGEIVSMLINLTLMGYPSWLLWTVYLLPVLLLIWAAIVLTRGNLSLAKDLGHLADQVESVRAGDLSNPLILPEDGDLRKTAERLNDIQAGMKAALAEQTRSERMKVELVSNVSHDLKTPLTSILSYAELLRQEDLPPAAADYARIIDEKARRLKSMVQDVFEVSKAAADQLPVQPERLDLAKLLRQTLADMDGPIQRSALTFKIDLPKEPVMITADGKRLYRVFQNLIDNALRYALEGSRVYLSLKTGEGLASASVRNTSRTELAEGVDFTARFVRGDASRTDGGSGLGLSIAKSFTEACGGDFRVETMADLFTATVTFPLS